MKSGWETFQAAARFMKFVSVGDGCWTWTGSKNQRGYGQFRLDGSPRLAHRVAYTFRFGPIPNGLAVCHRCDVPSCVRPDHLFVGTIADNNADMRAKGRGASGDKIGSKVCGEQQGAHVLTRAQVEDIRARASRGETHSSLAIEFGVCRSTVTHAVSGRNWRVS